MEESYDKDDADANSQTSSTQSSTWNSAQEDLLKGISERSNCLRWLHTQCNIHFESLNFYFTIPNVIISTLNGSVTMSLTALFPDPDIQKIATTIIGLVSIFSAVLITMNQYVKSQQMMEAHRTAGLAYGKLHRIISNELAMRRDQRSNAFEFLKMVRTEQDRLENSSPTILPSVIKKFNIIFKDREIEKPEIAGDLDETVINKSRKERGAVETPIHKESSVSSLTTPIKQYISTKLARVTSKIAPIRDSDADSKEAEEILTNIIVDRRSPMSR